jgi:hypothetical protein
MILDTFLDESGDARRERFIGCGGFVGLDNYWDQLDLLWLSRTDELKDPFHATDCECGYGQFSDWSNEKRKSLMTAAPARCH